MTSYKEGISMDEAQILIGLKAGDKKAWDLLYDLLYKRVYFITSSLINETMEAEDIAIKSLVKFWEKGPESFESFPQAKAFIFKTAKNAAIDYLEKLKAEKNRHMDLAYLNGKTEESIAIRGEKALYKAEMFQTLLDEIEKLPDQCREAFKLVCIQNISRPVVAEQLGVTVSTVNNHVANAKNRLRQIFSEKELIIMLLFISLCPN